MPSATKNFPPWPFIEGRYPPPERAPCGKYKGIYRQNDEQVGQWSDVASIGVMG